MLKFSSSSLCATVTRSLVVLFLLAMRLPAAAQAPAWQSARAVAAATVAANGNNSIVNATSVDAAGNVYLAGQFTNTVVLGGTTLTSLGRYDVFVAKFNPVSNQFAWAQRAGGTGDDQASSLTISGTSLYVAGNFQSSTANFGPLTLTNEGSADMFIAKITDAGSTVSFTWAQRAGGSGNDNASALAVSGNSVYMVGYFDSTTAGFGPVTLTSVNSDDVFVTKLTDAGNTSSFAWAQRAGGTGSDQATALAVSGINIYVVGSLYGSVADFGTTTLFSPNNYSYIGFLASLIDPTLTATAAGRTLAPAQLYPNTAHHTATLRLPAGTAPAPLTLTDALGRAVRRYPAPACPEATLDLQGLPAGLYLLRGAGPAPRLAVE